MNKYLRLVLVAFLLTVGIVNVNAACGDLSPSNVTVNVSGYKVTQSGNTYTITLSSPVSEVYLSASPDVGGGNVRWQSLSGVQYGPRRVKTNTVSEMRLRKSVCNEDAAGVYIYKFKFVVASNSNNGASNTNNNTSNNTNTNTNNNTPQSVQSQSQSQSESQSESESQSAAGPKLSSIEVDGFDLKFDKDTYEYRLTTGKNLKKLDIKTKTENNTDKVTISSNYKNLHSGNNTININVTNAENVTTKYTIVLNKTYRESDDATLKSLSIEGYTIDFKPDVYEYAISLMDGQTKLEKIEAVPNDSKAKVVISGNENLTQNSEVKITVTAEDGTINEYKIYTAVPDNTYLKYIIYAAAILFIIFLLLLIITTSKKKKRRKKAKVATESEPAKSSSKGKKPARKKSREFEGAGVPIKEVKVTPGTTHIKNEPKQDVMPGPIVKNEPKKPATSKKNTFETIEPNKDTVNIDEHLQIVQPDNVDEDLSKTEVFKM